MIRQQRIPAQLAVAIFSTPGRQKHVAHEFGVSQGTVSRIKASLRRAAAARRAKEQADAINASLVTAACGVAP